MQQVDSPKTPSLLAAHMTAAEIYESVTNGGATDFAELVKVLNRNKPWCLIGGLAVNCYVEPVYTVDVDVVVVAANLEQIGRELEAAGFRLKRFEHSMNAQRPISELNVPFTTDARYQHLLANASERASLAISIHVARMYDSTRAKA